MKTKVLMGVLVACLLGASSLFMFARNNDSQEQDVPSAATVKICPKSGLPCDGGGDCGHDHGESPCDGGCCGAKTEKSGCCGNKTACSGCAAKKESCCAGTCEGCPGKAAGTCPKQAAAEVESTPTE